MALASETSLAIALPLTAVMALQPFGIPMERATEATVFVAIAAGGKSILNIAKCLEAGGKVEWGRSLASAAVSLMASPFIAVLCLAIAGVFDVTQDSYVLFLLLLIGYTGPAGVSWIIAQGQAFLQGMLQKKTGSP